MGDDKEAGEEVVMTTPGRSEDQEEENKRVTVGGVSVSYAQLPMIGMFFSAIILLVAILVGGSRLKNYEYTISVAAVAMFFSLLGFLLTCKEDLNGKISEFNGYFLFLWCFIGACIITFDGPFKVTSNGYFASWSLAICSTMGVGVTGKAAKSAITGIGAAVGLGACAIVVIAAIVPEIRDDNYRNEGIYALSVSCVTIVLVGFLAYQGHGQETVEPSKLKFVILAIFSILWIILASIVTFQGPFRNTGNGYFGSWVGAIMSVKAAMGALKGE